MAINIKAKKAGAAEVSLESKHKGQMLTSETKNEVVQTPDAAVETVAEGDGKPMSPYCEVGFEASYTHNLGNYESSRVVVSVKIPCLHPEIDEAFEYAKAWVDKKLGEVNAEIVSGGD